MFPVLSANGTSGYSISNSLRFQSASSTNASRTPASTTNRKTWTWSAWIKRGALNNGSGYQTIFSGGATASDAGVTAIFWNPSDSLTVGGATTNWLITSQVFRDPSAWYHIVVAMDTTNATANNRLRIYVNGSEVTAFGTRNNLTLNADYGVNQNALHVIGYQSASMGIGYSDGYQTEINFIDGQALTPSSFGTTDPTSGQWVAKKYAGTYGTNGFYLPFSNGTSTTTLGADSSGNGNNWTLTNFTRSAGVSDCWMTDVPSGNGGASGTQPSSNYAVLNPLNKHSSVTVSNANLNMTVGTAGNNTVLGSIGITSGKWFFEANNSTGFNNAGLGFASDSFNPFTTAVPATGTWIIGQYVASNQFHTNSNNGGNVQVSTSTTGASGYLVCAIDYDNGKAWFGNSTSGTITWYPATNGGTVGNPALGTNPTITFSLTTPIYPLAFNFSTGSAASAFNFGQRSFSATPPTGFKALCTANLPVATIKQGNKYMDATLYTGNGSTQTITNASGFKPDLVWVKSRSAATDNKLTDSVRGVQKGLISDTTGAETTDTNGLTAFNSNGWSLGTDTIYNNNAATYVGWQWQAGQGSTSSNTSGTITSTVSVNATAGFSVVTWTGNGVGSATVGHGLGVTPAMVISKGRSYSNDWWVGHKGSSTGILKLNATDAINSSQGTNGSLGFQQYYTSTTFGFNNGTSTINNANQNGITYVAYCFAEIAGFSKFGSYTGNGSADGTFVYLGFRPKYVMVKYSSSADNWDIFDSVRNPYNLTNNKLYANLSDAESADAFSVCDLLSNGFKLRGTGNQVNANGGTYIYMAFAESPFQNSNSR